MLPFSPLYVSLTFVLVSSLRQEKSPAKLESSVYLRSGQSS